MLIEEMQFKVYGKDILKQEDFQINGECVRVVMKANGIKRAEIAELLEIFPQSVHPIYAKAFVTAKVRKALMELIPGVNFMDDDEFKKYLSKIPQEEIERIQIHDDRRYRVVGTEDEETVFGKEYYERWK